MEEAPLEAFFFEKGLSIGAPFSIFILLRRKFGGPALEGAGDDL